MAAKKIKKGKKGGIAVAGTGPKISPVAAGVMGAVAGAAVGATAGVVLSNEKTRKNVMDAVSNLSDRATEYTKQGSKKVQELRGKAADVMDKAQKQLGGPTQTQGIKHGQSHRKEKKDE